MHKEDNAKVCFLLEESTRGASYAGSIKSFQKRKNGRDAWLSLVLKYAGNDTWEAEPKKQEEFVRNSKWKGQNNYPLASHIDLHRNEFISLMQCAEHVEHQLPNEATRVKYLLGSINCHDAKLLATIAMIDNDKKGTKKNFESMVAYLTPYDPVAF